MSPKHDVVVALERNAAVRTSSRPSRLPHAERERAEVTRRAVALADLRRVRVCGAGVGRVWEHHGRVVEGVERGGTVSPQ